MTDIINIINNINTIQKRKQIINTMIQKINGMEFIEKYKNFGQIIGPSSIVVYKINNKLIILFQDVHTEPSKECNATCSKNGCEWIHEFLEQLFIKSPVCIDFFNETTNFLQMSKGRKENIQESKRITVVGYLGNIIKTVKSYANEIGLIKSTKKFADCLGPLKSGCEIYNKVRFHNIEFRRFENNVYNITSFQNEGIFRQGLYYLYPINFELKKIKDINYIKNINVKKYDNYKIYLDKLSLHKNILEALLDGDMKKVSENILLMNDSLKDTISSNILNAFSVEKLENVSPYKKLAKQFKPLPKQIQTICKTFLLERYDAWIIPLIDTINKIKDNNKQKNLHEINNNLITLNFYYGVILFDAYTIGRMLKSIYIYQDSSMIITYAGKSHTKGYSKLFAKMNDSKIPEFKLEKITELKGTKKSACVNIDNYKTEWNKIINELTNLFNNPTNCAVRFH